MSEIYGTSENDLLRGGAGDDNLYGRNGADTLQGGGGFDVLDGEAGIDTAVFSGTISGYSFSNFYGSLLISDSDPSNGDVGADYLYGIDKLKFSDVEVAIFNQANLVVSGYYDDPQLTALSNGGFVAVWSADGAQYDDDISGQMFSPGGVRQGDVFRVNTATHDDQDDAVLASLSGGGFIIVWTSYLQDGSEEGVYGQRYGADGARLGNEFRINTSTANSQQNASIVGLSDGGFVVTWEGAGDGDDWGVFTQRYDQNGVAQGGESLVNTTTVYDQQNASTAALSEGGYVVVWESWEQDGENGGIYSQRFDNSGLKVGVETRLNVSTAGSQENPALAALSDGGFVAAWESDGDIIARRYSAAGTPATGQFKVNDAPYASDVQVTGTPDGGFGFTFEAANERLGKEYSANGEIKGEFSRPVTFAEVFSGSDRFAIFDSEGLEGHGLYSIKFNFEGDVYSHVFEGGSGADVFVSYYGWSLRAYGKDGDDIYIVQTARDIIVESAQEGSDTVYSDLSWTLGNNFENIVLNGFENINATGNALENSIKGNGGGNVLSGGGGADTLIGGAGDDTYLRSLGDVLVEELNEGGGTDTVISDGNFSLPEKFENLTLTGTGSFYGNGNGSANHLLGNSGENLLQGAAGNDTLNGGAGSDTLRGGLGDDRYFFSTGDVLEESANAGTDMVLSSSNFSLDSNFELLVLTGTSNSYGSGNALANTVTGNSGNNLLQGEGGNDTLNGGAGADTLRGGSGDDRYIRSGGDVLEEAAGAGTDVVLSDSNFTLDANFEQLELTGSFNSYGNGNSLANTLTGNTGNNLLQGLGGNDTLNGGASADTLRGGSGDDRYIWSAGDVLEEAAGAGTDLVLSDSSFTLELNFEQLELTGSSNSYGTGNGLANTLTGNSGNNLLEGNSGKDTLNGGAGIDTLRGGSGDDRYIRSAGDVLEEAAGAGTDLVLSDSNFTLDANFEQLELTGSSNSYGNGNSLANALTGNTGNNLLQGLGGNDTLNGGAGADTLRGGSGDDRYIRSAGDVLEEAAGAGTDLVISDSNFTLDSNFENLALTGSSNSYGNGNELANILNGNSGNNLLQGASGNDTLNGIGGMDTLVGGAGIDTFVFNTALNAMTNLDTIKDWDIGGAQDRIVLDDDVFLALGPVSTSTSAALDPTMFVTGAAALDANDRIIYNQSTGALFYDADGVGGVGQVQFAILGSTTHPVLGAGDFVVVG